MTHADGTIARKTVNAGGDASEFASNERNLKLVQEERVSCAAQADLDAATAALPPGAPVAPVAPNSSDSTSDLYGFLQLFHSPFRDYPTCNRQLLKAKVHGVFPMSNNYAFLSLGDIRMPEDWARFATAINKETLRQDPSAWDIHDDNANPNGTDSAEHLKIHKGWGAADCKDIPHYWFVSLHLTLDGFDTVDNCFNNSRNGPFTRISGAGSLQDRTVAGGNVIGPFDPVNPDTTWLPDGKLDENDAPMPAAELDFNIMANSGSKGDISGVGALGQVTKSNNEAHAYHRPFYLVDPVTKAVVPHDHQYYAPFYRHYLGATSRPGVSSGITGDGVKTTPSSIGWWNGSGVRPFWRVETSKARSALTGDSSCLWYFQATEIATPESIAPKYRPLPYGAASTTVYTDEHGEAYAAWSPQLGAYWDSLGRKNLNNGCDLKGVTTLGTADIQAVAHYPYQPAQGVSNSKESGKVGFTVNSLFDKSITVYPKGTGSDNDLAKIVVVHANDIDGAPFINEVVCVGTDGPGLVKRFGGPNTPLPGKDGVIGTADDVILGLLPVSGIEGLTGLGRLCSRTDENGNAGFEVMGTGIKTFIASYESEGLLRSAPLDFTVKTTAVTTSTTTPSAAQIGAVTKASVASGQAAGPVSDPQKKAVALAKNKKAAYRVAVARLVLKAKGHALVIRVNGKAGTAKLRITIRVNGKTRVIIRTVKTNRVVTVRKLGIKPGAKIQRVAVSVR